MGCLQSHSKGALITGGGVVMSMGPTSCSAGGLANFVQHGILSARPSRESSKQRAFRMEASEGLLDLAFGVALS